MTRTKFPASEIDWEDDSGVIAFTEYQKKRKTRERIKDDISKVISLSPKDWILIFIHANKGGVLKVPLFKHLFIFSKRTGLDKMFNWYPGDYGPHCVDIENALDKLDEEGVIKMEIGTTANERIYKRYILKDTKRGEELWNLLPEKFKSVILEIISEFGDSDIEDLLHYTYSAYPEYAVKSKFQPSKI